MYLIPTIKEKQYLYGNFNLMSEYKKSFGDVVLVYTIVEVYNISTIIDALRA